MSNSVAFFDAQMNITQRVANNTRFYCYSCDWRGVATELGNLKGMSCCPKCRDFDVRVDFEIPKKELKQDA